eukprot:c7353_g1_i1.p2 GENE.c7353_g1_i1~~c7353_g1_i1.p2  ORF type:complete len:208 (+),score=54.70 c7353_g1_i1:619-1242(+)
MGPPLPLQPTPPRSSQLHLQLSQSVGSQQSASLPQIRPPQSNTVATRSRMTILSLESPPSHTKSPDDGIFIRPRTMSSNREGIVTSTTPTATQLQREPDVVGGIFVMDEDESDDSPSKSDSELSSDEEFASTVEEKEDPAPLASMLSTSLPINIPSSEAMILKRFENFSEPVQDPLEKPPHTLAEFSGFDQENYPSSRPSSRKFSVM